MTSKLIYKKIHFFFFSNYGSNLCFGPKCSKKKINVIFMKHFLNAMIRNKKKNTIFLILLKFQSLWNLINVFIKKV